MNSSEYHKIRSELYFSRMLLWLIYILVVSIAKHCGMLSHSIMPMVLGILFAISCGVTSFLEHRRAYD